MTPEVEIRNSEPGGFSGELALSQNWRGSTTRGITRDSFAPYRTHYELWRSDNIGGAGNCISAGMLTSVNLNGDRDTILINGKDWIHYLQRRIYPFDPELYKNGGWVQWPRQWPDVRGAYGPRDYILNPTQAELLNGDPIDVGYIIREIIQSTQFDPPTEITPVVGQPLRSLQWPAGAETTQGRVRITQNVKLLEQFTKYKIYPGDSTSIYDHLTKLSEQVEAGFEFDIQPLTREFQVWNPRRNSFPGIIYVFEGGHADEGRGAITEFDWTNDGPEGTYLVGLAKKSKNVGKVWTTSDNVNQFGRLDKIYDFGEVSEDTMILELLKDQDDLHPQKRLGLALSNPEFMVPNFYTGGRPRNLLGATVLAVHSFPPYHTVNAAFRVNAIKWNIDNSTNENVSLELEMVYE